MKSSDNCVGMETEGGLKECGTPLGNRHTPGIPPVETTSAPTRDNPNKRPRISNNMIHTDAIIARQMEIFQPVCPPEIKPGTKQDRRRECELIAIEVMKTGMIPQYNSRDMSMLKKFYKRLIMSDVNLMFK